MVAVGIHGHEWAMIRLPYFHEIGAATGRRYSAFRDIVVRTVAEARDPATTTLADICSHALTTVSPTDSIEQAVQLMRAKAIRRLPVVEGGQAVGIVSLGDLAVERDPSSALGDISAAPPNT